MDTTPTPRTDKAAYYMGRTGEHRDAERWCDLLNESRAIEREMVKLKAAVERMGTDASAIQCLSYGPDGDCGAVRIAERIEYECDQILQANEKGMVRGAPESPLK